MLGLKMQGVGFTDMGGQLKELSQLQNNQQEDQEKRSKTGRSARRRGANAERELAAILTDELGFVVKRKLGQARDGGDDIQVGQYRIEVKRREALRLDEWCKQIEQASQPGDVPVVAYRRNGQPWRVVVPLEWFIEQVRETLGNEPAGDNMGQQDAGE